jgi:hypothetical protein
MYYNDLEQHQGHGHSAQMDLLVPDFVDVNICKSIILYLFCFLMKLWTEKCETCSFLWFLSKPK